MGEIGSAVAAQTLFRAIQTGGSGVRKPAIDALGHIRDVGAIPLLLKVIDMGTEAQMAVFKNCVRAAGWRLAAVEIEQQAAQRGVRALKGGSASLLTQAPQDWQFQLDRVASRPPYEPAEPSEESDDTIAQALEQIMRTPGGARLVAAGLALKAWH